MIILLPQILLHHIISKSVPITESYSKTIGLRRRNGSTIESIPKEKKKSEEKKGPRGWEGEVKNKTVKKEYSS